MAKLAIPFKVKVVKIGASLRITIPKQIAEYLDIKAGDSVALTVEDSTIHVKKD